jgi:tRNA-dihydrouridine synthase
MNGDAVVTHNNNNSSSSTPPIPVDRQWLQKLVAKYSSNTTTNSNNNENSVGTAEACSNGNSNGNSISRRDDPLWVLAPMVDQSDLPFRLLCRRYNVPLCFTPMIHCKLYTTCPVYKGKFTLKNIPDMDRPLIAQICGSDFDSVLETCRDLEPYCDGIDINCGCPQGIAKRGNYGAFLLEQQDVLVHLVEKLVQHLTVPLSVKVRLLPWPVSSTTTKCMTTHSSSSQQEHNNKAVVHDDPAQPREEGEDDDEDDDDYDEDIPCDDNASDDDCPIGNAAACAVAATMIGNPNNKERALQASMRLYERLVNAGVHMLTIHGRNRLQKGPLTGPADWQAIAQVVQRLGDRIPILANGSIASRRDALHCLQITGADGIMSSEAILEYPALFHHVPPPVPEPTPAPCINDSVDADSHHHDTIPQQRIIGRLQLTREYLALAQQYPPDQGGQASSFKCIRGHVHRFLHADLQQHLDIRQRVCHATSMQHLLELVDWVQAVHDASHHDVCTEDLSWYRRHSQVVRDTETGMTMKVVNLALQRQQHESKVKSSGFELDHDDDADCFSNLFSLHNNNNEENGDNHDY